MNGIGCETLPVKAVEPCVLGLNDPLSRYPKVVFCLNILKRFGRQSGGGEQSLEVIEFGLRSIDLEGM